MAKFPESPKPIYPLVITPRWRTLISDIEGGGEQRKQKRQFAVYDVTVRYRSLSESQMQTIYDFYMARKGALEAFHIYDLALLSNIAPNHSGLYCGTGDGTTEVFDIPGRSTSSQVIYKNGIEQTLTTDYTISSGTGSDGSDQVDFVTAPAAGDIISCDFTGFLRIRARFAEDKLDRELFRYLAFNFGISLTGVDPIT